MVGAAETVAKKILFLDTKLGGLARVAFQMSVASLPHEQTLRAIERIGNQVIPLVKNEKG